MIIASAPTDPWRASQACAMGKRPHLTKKPCLLWEYPEFDSVVRTCSWIPVTARGRSSPGTPQRDALYTHFRVTERALIASEVTGGPFLEIYEKMIAKSEAGQQKSNHGERNEPLSSTDLGRMKAGESGTFQNTCGPGKGSGRRTKGGSCG